MTADDSPIDYIDYTSVDFPSDRITVRDIRRAHPERFDVENGKRFDKLDDDPTFTLGLVIYMERLLARSAYERALGKTEIKLDYSGLSRDDCLDELTEYYQTYRVASGRQHTEQLIRDMESQAAAQVPRRDSPGPG